MSQRLIPNNQRLHNIRQFTESISEQANSVYYLFLANHVDDLSTTDVFDCDRDVTQDVYENLIMGKRVASSDVTELIRSNPYVSNTVYDMYDNEDTALSTKDFFVYVNEGSFSHVYKCLDNNLGNFSTAQPTFAHITGANTDYYRTSDGYTWKYMYSFDTTANNKFATTDSIPVVANATVSSTAIAGQLDVIKINGVGRKYDNYIVGTFATTDVAINGNGQIFQISNTVARNANGFYTGCMLYLALGPGAGQYKRVTDYYSNTTGKYVVIDSTFTTAPTNATEYEIYPYVAIKSSGHVTTNADARALINALASNSVYRVEFLNKGRGYDYYATANVVANAVVGVQSNADLRVILSPPNGHGYDAAQELYANHLEVSVTLSNSESNTVPTTNRFSQIGIMKDPVFANVGVQCSNLAGVFLSNEYVYKLNPSRIASNCTVNLSSNAVTIALDKYHNNLVAGDMLFLVYETENLYQLTKLSSIVNSTAITMNINAYTTATDVTVYRANESTYGIVSGTNTAFVTFSKLYGTINTGDLLVGNSSGALTYANATIMNYKTKGFSTFIGMSSLLGNVVSGSFALNETVYQGNLNTSNASLHSVVTAGSNTTMYFTRQKEVFLADPSKTIFGQNSGATFSPSKYQYPDIVYGSGEVLFVEDVEPITRAAANNETFKIIFTY